MLMLKKTIAALSLLSILAACQNDENPSQPEPKPRQDINLTRAEQEFMDKGTDFAFRFFDQVCSTEKEKPNVFVSPLSASLCLSMITNGATDNTLAEMQNVLGFPANTFSLDDLNNYNQKLTSALLDLDNTIQLGIANSIWIEEGYTKGFVLLYDRRSTLYNQCLLYYLLSRIESTILFYASKVRIT